MKRLKLGRWQRMGRPDVAEGAVVDCSSTESGNDVVFSFSGVSCRVVSLGPGRDSQSPDALAHMAASGHWERCTVTVHKEALELTRAASGGGEPAVAAIIPIRQIAEAEVASRDELVAVLQQGLRLVSDAAVAEAAAVAEVAEFETPWSGIEGAADTGAFELPPIPLAQLPVTSRGLPEQAGDEGAEARQLGVFEVRLTQRGFSAAQYDQSNVCASGPLDSAIPPLPPSTCRLPKHGTGANACRDVAALTDRAERSEGRSEGLPQVSSRAPWAHVVVVRIAGSRSQGADASGVAQLGGFVCLSFPSAELSEAARVALCASKPRSRSVSPSRWGKKVAQAPPSYVASSTAAARPTAPRPAG